MRGALAGLLVVALEHAVAAPFCTRKLVEAGARVIKVERPEGDFARRYDSAGGRDSSFFAWLNYGKESVVLNLRDDDDRGVLRGLLGRADILVQNLAPGALERLGFGAAARQRLNPRLISCSITGYARPAAQRQRKAYDLLVQAESGLASVTGAPASPGRVGISVVDIATGTTAYHAVLEALLARAASGEVRELEISMFDVMAEWMTVPLLQYAHSGVVPRREELRHPSIAPYGVFRCADGAAVLLAVQNDREWAALTRVIADPVLAEARFAGNVERVQHRELIDGRIGEWLGKQDFASAVARLDAAGVAHARISGVDDLAGHPSLARMAVACGDLELSMPVPGDRAGHTPACPLRVPALGEHSAAIRAEFGAG